MNNWNWYRFIGILKLLKLDRKNPIGILNSILSGILIGILIDTSSNKLYI